MYLCLAISDSKQRVFFLEVTLKSRFTEVTWACLSLAQEDPNPLLFPFLANLIAHVSPEQSPGSNPTHWHWYHLCSLFRSH